LQKDSKFYNVNLYFKTSIDSIQKSIIQINGIENKDMKNNKLTPKLRGDIVETILQYCINEKSIYELSFETQKILPIPYSDLKKYLFYLTSHEFISYNGNKKIFLTTDEGRNLLNEIQLEKQFGKVNGKDIKITIE